MLPCANSRKHYILERDGDEAAAHAAVVLADQLKLWTNYRLNDRLDRVEGRTQRAVEAVPLGHESG